MRRGSIFGEENELGTVHFDGHGRLHGASLEHPEIDRFMRQLDQRTVYGHFLDNGSLIYVPLGLEKVELASAESSTVACVVAVVPATIDLFLQLFREHVEGSERFSFIRLCEDGPGGNFFTGCHENHLVDFRNLVLHDGPVYVEYERWFENYLATFQATRLPLIGNGAIVPPSDDPRYPVGSFILSARHRITNIVMSKTAMGKTRPLVLVRDSDPLGTGDGGYYRRLQFMEDANEGEIPQALKYGVLDLVLGFAEEFPEEARRLPKLEDPVAAVHAVNRDLEMRQTFPCTDGKHHSALEIQRLYLEKLIEFRFWEGPVPSVSKERRRVLALFDTVLEGLERDSRAFKKTLDHPLKRHILEHALQKSGVAGFDELVLRLAQGNDADAQEAYHRARFQHIAFHEIGNEGRLGIQPSARQLQSVFTTQEHREAHRRPPGELSVEGCLSNRARDRMRALVALRAHDIVHSAYFDKIRIFSGIDMVPEKVQLNDPFEAESDAVNEMLEGLKRAKT